MDPISWATGAIVLSSVSLIGSLLVIYQIYRSQDTLTTSHEALVNAIFWMVFMDVFVSLWIIILYVPQFWGDVIYKEDTWRVGFCAFLGFVIQFAISASCAWYFMIALMTVFLLRGASTESIRRSIVWQHLFVWGVSGSGALVLLIFGSLGIDVAMANAPPVECWLSKNQAQNSLWLYVPIFVYMAFSLFLLIYAALKVRTFRDSQKVSRRMIAFILMFICVWMIPVVDRLRYVSNGESPPPMLAFVHWGVISLSGFANSVIWVSTKSSPTSRHHAVAEDEDISSSESISYGDKNKNEISSEEGSFEHMQWTLLQKELLSPEVIDGNIKRDASFYPPATGFTPHGQRLAQQMEAKKLQKQHHHHHHHHRPPTKKSWHQKMYAFRKQKPPQQQRNNDEYRPPTYVTSDSLVVVDQAEEEITTTVN